MAVSGQKREAHPRVWQEADEKSKGAFHFCSQNRKRLRDTRSSGRSKSVGVGAANEHGPRPRQIAFTTSLPRRTPPSIKTSIWPFTAATISGSARREADTESNCRPPWFDTTTAAAPSSIGCFASSAIRIPLTITGPDHDSRIHFRSANVTVDSDRAVPTSTKVHGSLARNYDVLQFGTPPSSRKEITHPGCERQVAVRECNSPARSKR